MKVLKRITHSLFSAYLLKCAALPNDLTLREYLENKVCEAKRLDGKIADLGCDYETVNLETEKIFVPILDKLAQTTFFKYYRVNLEQRCPFWQDDGVCMIKDCSVCECTRDEIPKPWILEDFGPHPDTTSPAKMVGDLFMESAEEGVENCQEQNALQKQCADSHGGLGNLDRTRGGGSFTRVPEGYEIYVDLLKNPEGYTGYSGPSAAKVWGAIHKENVFAAIEQEQCLEKRVFYRLISGLQGSITTQIAIRYKFEDNSWGYNPKLWLKGVGQYHDRLDNMYFTFVFLLRAISRASSQLLSYPYNTGDSKMDKKTASLMKALLEGNNGLAKGDIKATHGRPKVAACWTAFDDSALLKLPANVGAKDSHASVAAQDQLNELKEELVAKFNNISAIMDCVGCEKCKMWGKLQTHGIGTALKILLTPESQGVPELSRNEIVALLNTAKQFAKSVRHVVIFKELEISQKINYLILNSCFGTVGAVLLLLLWRYHFQNLTDFRGRRLRSNKVD